MPRRQHRRVLGSERRRVVPVRYVRVRELQVRHPRLRLQVRQGPDAGPEPRRALRARVGRLQVSEQGHPVVPAPRCQGPPLHRRRRGQLRPVVRTGRPRSGRLPLEHLPGRHLVVPPPRRRRPRRRRLRHRERRRQVLGQPRQGPQELGQEEGQQGGASERGAAVPVPGRVGQRRDRHGAVRLRVGAVLQQRAVPGERWPRRVPGGVEEVAVGAGGEDLPGTARRQERGGHRVRARRPAHVAGAAAHQGLAQVRRRHALVKVLRRPHGLQQRHQETCLIISRKMQALLRLVACLCSCHNVLQGRERMLSVVQ